jgi:hypothetical protein
MKLHLNQKLPLKLQKMISSLPKTRGHLGREACRCLRKRRRGSLIHSISALFCSTCSINLILALAVWHSGHRAHQQERRSRVRIPPGCKVLRVLYTLQCCCENLISYAFFYKKNIFLTPSNAVQVFFPRQAEYYCQIV